MEVIFKEDSLYLLNIERARRNVKTSYRARIWTHKLLQEKENKDPWGAKPHPINRRGQRARLYCQQREKQVEGSAGNMANKGKEGKGAVKNHESASHGREGQEENRNIVGSYRGTTSRLN